MSVTLPQLKAAIAMLDLTQNEVAELSGVSSPTISNMFSKSPKWKVKDSTINLIADCLTAHGIEFTEYEGVRIKPSVPVKIYEGQIGFRQFMDDVYNAAAAGCNEFRLQNARPDNWITYLGTEWYEMHAKRMIEQANSRNKDDRILFQVTCCEGDVNHIGVGFAHYKWVKKEHFNEQSIYIYADTVAFLTFKQDVKIISIKSSEIRRTMAQTFDLFWEHNTFEPKAG